MKPLFHDFGEKLWKKKIFQQKTKHSISFETLVLLKSIITTNSWIFLVTCILFLLLLLFILITQARFGFSIMTVIYTDVGLHLEFLPQIPRYNPSLCSVLNYELILLVKFEPTVYLTLELWGECLAKWVNHPFSSISTQYICFPNGHPLLYLASFHKKFQQI